MKNHRLFILAGCLWASSLLAQTADDYVTMGRTNLVAQNLVAANADFNLALGLSPTNEDANALVAVTRLLLLPTQPAGSNFLNSIGFTNSGRNVYNWTSTLPKDTNGNTVLPSNNTSVMIAFYRTNIMAALAASRTNLAQITDTSFTLSLTADETSIESVTVDYGDILLLQALERVAEFAGYTLNAQNCDVVLSQLHALGKTNGLTIQSVLSLYPSLLMQSSTSDLTNSKIALTNAIMLYQQASDFIRNVRQPGVQGLFNLSPDETNNEALFRTELTNALLSLNQPVQFNTNEAFSIYAGAYFAGTKSLRSLMPKFYGDVYVNDTLPDYTFGGILVNEPAYLTEAMLRRAFYSYAGIYGGQVEDITFGDPDAGVFAVFVSTNQQVTVVGYDIDSYQNINGDQSGGVSAQFNVDQHGNWSFQSNSVSGFGSVSKDGSFNGELNFTNGDSVQLINGYELSAWGPFQTAAGNYSGTWVSGSYSGNLMAVLAANGQLVFCVFHNGAQNDGGQAQFGSNNQFITTDTSSGSTIAGTLNSLTMSGTFTNSDATMHGTWSMSRSANVAFDVPPVITTLPANKILPLGTNATFSLVATGSPPLCYQWYFNGVTIPNAITNTLVVSNLQYSSAGAYSVTINNCAGGTNAAATLTVVPETIPPTNQITAPTPGLQVSNANYTITGKAGDNVAVSNVFYSLNNTGWSNAVTGNNWTNWSAAVTLTPGTNIVQAYAMDTSGNVSTTNSVSFVFVLSAVLTVNTNGYGTISPNYNGALLQIGKNYSMTATAASGFAFVNWTGSITTNGATLQFTMASNLTFTANFVDVARPTLSITNVTAGMNVSNASFTVKGTAGDNVAVSNVFYLLNNTGWSNAVTGNNWTNWTVAVTLLAGTNTIAAYAVDTSGNVSTTNTLSFVYVVSATLTVSTNGLGSLNPNYNGALLQIGKGYSITATAGTGFAFTNWTGGTSLPLSIITNGPTVQFLMVTDLMLQANFVDVARPTLSITNVTAGMNVSNASFTVKGTAGDNVAVSNVFYLLNNTGWSNAVTGNNWTNWTVAVTLLAGTNTIAAYAVDTSGNVSTTNTLSFVYVVSATLTVSTNGLGSLNPNYNGALLQIGKGYSITATAGTGFAFTNWTGGTSLPLSIITNGPTVQFLMVTDLMLQANFVDVARPTLSITNLASGQRLSNATFTVKGTASDNWMVSNVWCQINGLGWNSATNINNWTNWAAGVTLAPGTNVVQAYAVDTSSNVSTTSSVSFQFVVTNQLGVRAVGLGTLSPNYSNNWLEIGRNYSMAATPGNGFIFTNWVISTNWIGGLTTNNATVQFMMESNLTLQVSFVDVTKPTLTITAPTSGQKMTNALANVNGTASDNWGVSNVWYQLNSNVWSLAASTNGWTNWAVTLTLAAGTNTVKAYAVDLGANLSTTNSVSFVSSNAFQLQLGFAATQPMASNGLNFILQVSLGLNGRIEASTNLVNWMTLTNFVGTNAIIYFSDATTTNLNQRFYRAVTP